MACPRDPLRTHGPCASQLQFGELRTDLGLLGEMDIEEFFYTGKVIEAVRRKVRVLQIFDAGSRDSAFMR